jgi:ribonuclease R
MAFLAGRLRQRRFQNGALALETPEIVLQHDELGRVLNVQEKQSLQSYAWIEEFMLMANRVVARSLAGARLPLLWRIHEEPQFQGVEELRQFLGKLGMHWKPQTPVNHADYQQLIQLISKRPEKRYLMYRVLRSLQKARYDARHHGHYGLAFKQYTHFTSPIRRYPDLHNHRLVGVFSEHGADSSRHLPDGIPTGREVHTLGQALSERESSATDAERASIKLRVCEFLVDRLGEEADGFISGIAEFGLFIDIPEWGAEGLVHVESLQDDHYSSDPQRTQLRGEVSGRAFRFGQRLRVTLVRVDPDRRQIDLGLAS